MPSKYSSSEGKQMTDSNTTQRNSTTVLIAVLAALAGCEVIVISSDFSDGVRFGLGGLVALAIVAVVFQLSRNRTTN
jgi:hypothetical protein